MLKRFFVQAGVGLGHGVEVHHPHAARAGRNVLAVGQWAHDFGVWAAVRVGLAQPLPGGGALHLEVAHQYRALEADTGIGGQPLGLGDIGHLGAASLQVALDELHLTAVQYGSGSWLAKRHQ